MSSEQLQGLVSPSDIAEIAGVSRAAVSNWRDRRDDFPKPAGGSSAKPLFSLAEIATWLRANDYEVRVDTLGGRLWAAMNAVRGVMEIESVVRVIAALAALHKAEAMGRIESSAGLRAILDTTEAERASMIERSLGMLSNTIEFVAGLWVYGEVDRMGDRIVPIIEAILATEPSDLAESLDFVLERTSRAMMKSGGEHGDVDSRTSRLLCSLVGPSAQSVYDPACGIASALLCVAGDRDVIRLVGHEINGHALAMAQVRSLLRGTRVEFRAGDVIGHDPDPGLKVDVVIAEPPYGMRWNAAGAFADQRFRHGTPPESNADLAWVQHALAHLNDEGRAYVLTTPGATLRGGSEAKIRAGLVADGCVEAIVGLPARMLSHTTIAPTLWVLRRPSSGPILFIDASEVEDVEVKIAGWLDAARRGDLGETIPHARVEARDVLAVDAELVPGRWVADVNVDEGEIARQFESSLKTISRTVAELSLLRASLLDSLDTSLVRVSSVDELIKSRVLDYRPGRSPKSGDATVVKPADVRRGTLPLDAGVQRTSAQDLTRPGDVLVTTVHEVRAVVDEVGGHLVGSGVERISVLNAESLSPGYLAAVLTGAWNDRLMAGATVQRVPVRKLEVPIVPMSDQHRVEALHRTLAEVQAKADLLRNEAALLRGTVLDAVRYDVDLGSERDTGVSQDGGVEQTR